MSKENVEIVEEFIAATQWLYTDAAEEAAAVGKSDPDEAIRRYQPVREMVGFLAEDVVWQMVFAPHPVNGPSGAIRAVSEWIEIMAEWKVVDVTFIDAGEQKVLSEVTAVQRGRMSGAAISQRLFIVYTLSAGRITHYREYLDRDAALAAAGLSQ